MNLSLRGSPIASDGHATQVPQSRHTQESVNREFVGTEWHGIWHRIAINVGEIRDGVHPLSGSGLRQPRAGGKLNVINSDPAGMIHIGWDKLAQVIGGPSQAAQRTSSALQRPDSFLASEGPPTLRLASPTLPHDETRLAAQDARRRDLSSFPERLAIAAGIPR